MSTNFVHVLTIIGEAANEAESAFAEVLAKRIEAQPGCYRTEDWSESDQKDTQHLCERLIAAARNLPVLYYGAYIDGWSVANSMTHRLRWPGGTRREICGFSFSLAFYPSRFCEDILNQINRLRRTKLYRKQAEDRWFVDHIREAIQAALWLDLTFLVVAISEVGGPSRCDEEIKAAVKKPLSF
jgi:hypothetical protein